MVDIIEPCCYIKQFRELLSSIEGKGKPNAAHFFSNGDWTLSHLVDFFTGYVPGGEMFISLVSINESTLHTLATALGKRGKDGDFMVKHLTLLLQDKAAECAKKSLTSFVEEGRVTICQDRESFRCLAISNEEHHIVINGSINQEPVFSMQMFSITTSEQAYEVVRQRYQSKARTKRI